MKALRVVGPRKVEVQEVPDLVAGPGQILLDVERVGICGTDVELYTCLLYTSPSPRDGLLSRMPSSA